MPPDDPRNPSETPDPSSTNLSENVPLVDGATSDAESLMRILRGVARPDPAPAPAANGFPQIPGYEIESELGRGGMGVVYKARQLGLNRVVALKMILTSEPPSAGEITRFRAEAEAVAAIRHPNVVQVFELCPPDCERPYFAMEYVAGGSLAKLLKAHTKLAPRAAAELLAAVADGLQAAHDEGIVHRDIKPANVLLTVGKHETPSTKSETQTAAPVSDFELRVSNLLPKVSDFGLAKRLASDATRTQGMKGTPAYMAPEQAGERGGFVGPGADVYALGAVLFECLTGRPPFEGEDQWAVVVSVINAPPPAPGAIEPGVPRDLELICLKCLEKEPQNRYLTAAALAADLRRFAAGRPVSVRPVGFVSRAVRLAKRNPTEAALALLVALLLVVVPPVVVWAVGELNTSAAREREAQALAEVAHERARAAQTVADAAQALLKAATEAERREREAKDAALKLAQARELFALQNGMRSRAADRPLGWAAANRGDLLKAVALAAGEPGAVRELRSAGAVALLAADLMPLDPALKGFTASAAATDPNTGLVAVGEYLTWAPLSVRVWLVDPGTGRVERELSFTAGFVRTPDGGLRGAPDSVRALAFSPDGTKLFVGTRSSQVIRFDLDRPGNTEAARWKASTSAVEQLAVSKDGEVVYGLCRPEKPVFAWAAATGKLLAKLSPAAEAPITSFAVLGSGEVVTCDAHELRRWTREHKPALTVENDGAGRLAVAPSGVLLAGNRRNLDVYDPAALAPLDRFATSELRRGVHEENVRTIAVHPSGAFVVSCSGDTDRTLRAWELASCRLIGTVTVKGTGPIAVAWSGDGNTLLATGSGQLCRWAFRSGAAQKFACLTAAPVEAAAFGPEGRVAALAEPVEGYRELLVGTPGVPAGSARFVSLGGNGRPGVAFGPTGRLAVSTQTPGLIDWEPGTPVPAAKFTKEITWCPRFGPGERGKDSPLWAVVGSSDVCSFDRDEKAARTTWSNWVEGKTAGLASLDALAVGRTLVAAGGRSGSVHVLDAAKGQLIGTVPNSGDPVLALALAPDESLIVAGTQSGKVRLIRAADRTELPALAAHPDAVTAVSLSRDGSLLATGGRDRTVKLWKRAGERFEPLFTVPDLTGPVRELQFHPSGDRLLVLVAHERAVRVWDVDKLRSQLGRYRLAW